MQSKYSWVQENAGNTQLVACITAKMRNSVKGVWNNKSFHLNVPNFGATLSVKAHKSLRALSRIEILNAIIKKIRQSFHKHFIRTFIILSESFYRFKAIKN